MGMAAILDNGPRHFSNLSFSCPKGGSIWNLSNIGSEASEIINSFPYKCMRPIQMHTEANFRAVKGQMTMYDHHFSNFGRPPVPDDLCKDSAWRHPLFWRRFLKVFTIYGHGGHLGQWTASIIAIFHSSAPGRLQMKFEQQ